MTVPWLLSNGRSSRWWELIVCTYSRMLRGGAGGITLIRCLSYHLTGFINCFPVSQSFPSIHSLKPSQSSWRST